MITGNDPQTGHRPVKRRRFLMMAVGAAIGGVVGDGLVHRAGLTLAFDRSPRAIALALSSGAQFLMVDADHIQYFDRARAGSLMLKDEIDFVARVVDLSNELMRTKAVATDSYSDRDTGALLRAFYTRYSVGDGAVKRALELGHVRGAVNVALAGHCSGPNEYPAFCPPWWNVHLGWSKAEVVNYLLGQGYHQTADYASGYNADDYTKVVGDPDDYANCNTPGAWRAHALVPDSPDGQGSWYYSSQMPEPNPELTTYGWPEYPWWGDYVRWWHGTYC